MALGLATAAAVTVAASQPGVAAAPQPTEAAADSTAFGAMVPAPDAARQSPLGMYNYVLAVVRSQFYDRAFRGLRWDAMVDATRRQLGANPTEDAVRSALTGLLTQLHPAQARFLAGDEQDYWALASAFSGRMDGARLRQIGARFVRRGRRWFVQTVYADSPAAAAGLSRGDEIVSVDGDPLAPVESFRQLRPSEKARVAVRRLPWEEPKTLLVGTQSESFQESMLRTVEKGQRRFTRHGRHIAYVALPASTNDAFRVAITQAAAAAQLEADALVLDLRDGDGGADLSYLEPFLETPARAPTFAKPLVTLVNDGTRGGREWLARFLQKHNRGPLVGSPTPGAFLAGRLFELVPHRYALYLAVAPPQAPDRITDLEGHGLVPDVPVEDTLMYAAGKDPQLQQALETASGLVK